MASRLTTELQFTLRRLKNAWPELKGDPIGFAKLTVSELARLLKERLEIKNALPALTALVIVLSAVMLVVTMDAVSTLPFGLMERAIAAARKIQFLPAVKGSQPVSVYMQLEYNFNLY